MKNILVSLAVFSSLFFQAQTYVYSVKPDGTKDKNNYLLFQYDLVFKCAGCKEPFKDERSFEKNTRVIIDKTDREIIITEGDLDLIDPRTKIGFLTDSKKILLSKRGKTADGKPFTSNQATAAEEKKAPYIKDSKIYTSDHKIIGVIEGKEIYGAAWYLMNN